jgi:hypothetical protein
LSRGSAVNQQINGIHNPLVRVLVITANSATVEDREPLRIHGTLIYAPGTGVAPADDGHCCCSIAGALSTALALDPSRSVAGRIGVLIRKSPVPKMEPAAFFAVFSPYAVT